MRRIPALIGLLVVVSACAADLEPAKVEGSWQLVSGEVDGTAIPVLDEWPITIEFEDDRLGGTAACNSYGGTYTIDDGLFTITDVAMTEMACSPQEAMASENLYTTALFRAESVTSGDALRMSGAGVELVFEPLEPVPTAELLGTVWVLEGLIQGEAVSSVAGERATLELFSDGSFIGSTGCRDISGSYIVTGSEVAFTTWGASGSCPEDLEAQDSRVISALEGGFRVEIVEDTMTTWTSGDEGLVYKAER